jgi:hypothetical protein
MVYHLTRQDWSACTLEERVWLQSIPISIRDLFKKHRGDV